MSVSRTWHAMNRVENKVRSLLSAFTWFYCLDLSLCICLWNSGSFAFVMVSFRCLVRAIRWYWFKLSHLCCTIFCIVWTDSTIVHSATTLVSRTSRSPLGSKNGLLIFWNTAHKRLDMPEECSLCCWIILMVTSVWNQAWLVYPI